jgi:hypothetical protein
MAACPTYTLIVQHTVFLIASHNMHLNVMPCDASRYPQRSEIRNVRHAGS